MPQPEQPPKHLTAQAVIAVDGTHFALLRDASGSLWRLGASTPDWRAILAAMPHASPAQLSASGIWLQSAATAPPPLAAVCCGLGSHWPGMGRELYEQFPAARAAMDAVAALADWDILALLAESDLDRISQTRWQIPFLFMLEYAQWRLLRSCGLNAALLAGHSLGELVALCLAGVYNLPTAWYLLDTRAEHMARLEAKSGRREGMLVVPAPMSAIQDALEKWPDLRVANRNSERQHILGGPRASLAEARRHFRRAKIPAILLNIDLAFHNPAMRVLRDLSLLRLNGLGMRQATVPVISCVDACLYPSRQADICTRIADLDENAVDWPGCTRAMRDRYGIRHILEIGPQETLCGLLGENCPECQCIPTNAKNREGDAMRQALARLFALGALDFSAIAAQAQRKPARISLALPKAAKTADISVVPQSEREAIVDIIAAACGRDPKSIRPEHDLRHDLGLRSSNFPALLLAAEDRLGRVMPMDALPPLASAADLILFLAGCQNATAQGRPPAFFEPLRLPLERLLPEEDALTLAPIDPARIGPDANLIVACVENSALLDGVADLAARIAPLPITSCSPLIAERAREDLLELARAGTPVDGLVLEIPPHCADSAPLVGICADFLARRAQTIPWLAVIRRVEDEKTARAWLGEIESALAAAPIPWRSIAWVDSGPESQNRHEPGDLLALELAHGRARQVIWRRAAAPAPRYCPASSGFSHVRPAASGDGARFEGFCQFSRFAMPELSSHGANAPFSPNAGMPFASAPWLPLGAIAASLQEAAAFVAGGAPVASMADLSIASLPALPPGITRQCRVFASARMRIQIGGAPSRLCRVQMQAAQIAPNRRQTADWQEVAACICQAARTPQPVELIWQDCANRGQAIATRPLYAALGLGEEWHFLRAAQLLEDGLLGADLAFEDGAPFCRLIDAVLQAGMLALAQSAPQMAAELAAWRPDAIGLMQFGKWGESAANAARLIIGPAWTDARLRRFNGQIMDAAGAPLLVFRNLEFDHNPVLEERPPCP